MAGQFSLEKARKSRWPVLIAVEGGSGPAGVALNRAVCVVGAPGRAHLPLRSKQISKSHALLVQEADGVYVRDLCSTNKTFVNGKPIREARLNDKDLLRFGSRIYRCHSGFTKSAQAASPPPGELHLTGDSDSRQIRSLDQQTFLIGRRDGCDLVIHGEGIAAAHAVIFSQNGRRFLLDLASEGGILVNGTPVSEAELQPGDDIRIGDFQVEYFLQEQAASTEIPILEETPALDEIAVAQEQPALAAEEPYIAAEIPVSEEQLAVEESPAPEEEFVPEEMPVAEDQPVPIEPPRAAKPKSPAPLDLPDIEYPTEEQEPAYLRGEPLFLKCMTPFPVFTEKARTNDQLELRIEGDILTGALKRPAPNLMPRTNKRPPAVTSDEQLLSQSFVIRR